MPQVLASPLMMIGIVMLERYGHTSVLATDTGLYLQEHAEIGFERV